MNISHVDNSDVITSEHEMYLPVRFKLIVQLMKTGEFCAAGSMVVLNEDPVLKAQVERACLYVAALCMRSQVDTGSISGLEPKFPRGPFNIERQIYRAVLEAQTRLLASTPTKGIC